MKRSGAFAVVLVGLAVVGVITLTATASPALKPDRRGEWPRGAFEVDRFLSASASSFSVPSITDFSPKVVDPGQTVLIQGLGFGATAAENQVTVNGFVAGVQSATSTELMILAPSGTSGKISVTTAGGSAISAADLFIPPSPYRAADVETTASAVLGGPGATAKTTVPFKVALAAFEATAGQRISVRMDEISGGCSYLSVKKPSGTNLFSSGLTCGDEFFDVTNAPESGTYTILVDPYDDNIVNYTARPYEVPPDATGTITVAGAAETMATTVPGQNARFSFEGTAGQRISLHMDEISGGCSYLYVKKPSGTNLFSSGLTCGDEFFDVTALTETGTYAVVVDPLGADLENYRVSVYEVPPDSTGTIIIGGPGQTMATATPGQNSLFTFDATSGQRISIHMDEISGGCANLYIKRPSGTNLFSKLTCGDEFIDATTLTETGTHSVVLDPIGADVVNYTATVYAVPPDHTGTITIDGPTERINLSLGQNARLSFNGTAGQKLSLDLSDITISSSKVSVKSPSGATLLSPASVFTGAKVFSLMLVESGIHFIDIDPVSIASGRMDVALYVGPPGPTISSSSHPDETVFYSKPLFGASWVPPAGVIVSGYSVSLNSDASTVPPPTISQTTSAYSQSVTDGTWFLHVRTIDSSGLAGRTSHFKFNVDTTAPVVSELTSSSHPDPNVWYPQLNYNVSWSTAADLSGIAGYSLLVDRKADAVVDQWVDSESASLTGELLYGHEWYVRVRAKDKAGNWGPVQSLRIRGGVDVDPSIGVVPPEEPDDFVTEKTDGVEVRLDSIGTVDPWKISVVRNRELTPRSAKVMASPAYDIFVPSNATYSSAVVTVPYRPTLLNGWPEGALRLYHFDESIGLWVKASGNQLVDTEANTVSATVDHFSTYAVFALGQDGFEQFWPTREVFCVQNGSNGNGVDISFLMDTSGSMSSNDPNNLRVQAAKLFVDKMTTSDGAAVVGFEDVATRYIGLTRLDTASNRSAVLQALDSTAIAGGGTNIQAAVEEAITILTGNLPGRARVALLLSDGHSSAYNSAVTSAAKTAGIVVHTVGLGSDDATLLGSIANGTGGTYRRLTSAEQLPNAYAEIAQTLIDDGTDTDGDGLTDCEESNGMLTSSGIWGIAPDPFTNDRRVTSNPNDPDTENDGLTDGEELLGGVAPDALGIPLDLRDYPASVEEYSFLIKAGITKYFIMRSDPNLVDTDNEGLTDLEETRGKLHPNGQTYTCRPDLFDTDMDGNDDLTEFNIGSDCRLPDENELAIPGLPANTMFQPYFWSPRPVIASHWVARNGVLDYQILNSTPVIYDPADNRCMENCVALYDHAANQPDGSWCWVPFRECSSDEEQVRELVENAVESQHVFTDSGMFARTYAARQAVAECKSTTNDNPACADPAALKRAPDEISELLDDWIAEMILNIPGGYRPNDLCGNSSTDAGTYRLVEFNKKTGARTTRYVGQTSDFTVRRAQHLRDPRFKNLTFEPVHRTTNYQARRGLEQRLYNDTWGDVPISQAQAQGSLNGQRPIASNSPSLLERLELAQSFLTNC